MAHLRQGRRHGLLLLEPDIIACTGGRRKKGGGSCSVATTMVAIYSMTMDGCRGEVVFALAIFEMSMRSGLFLFCLMKEMYENSEVVR
ncbi:hypothetical protein [Leptolyngbya sp. Heron Island J]|uniref:hypothetical protein n=1 Tax=Leptolyngbya sp. Heron Island J TaxID=1385935 RepID=UPI000411C594|nr:hypothetical protein [Leptolyngbya sp. Heron Island J]